MLVASHAISLRYIVVSPELSRLWTGNPQISEKRPTWFQDAHHWRFPCADPGPNRVSASWTSPLNSQRASWFGHGSKPFKTQVAMYMRLGYHIWFSHPLQTTIQPACRFQARPFPAGHREPLELVIFLPGGSLRNLQWQSPADRKTCGASRPDGGAGWPWMALDGPGGSLGDGQKPRDKNMLSDTIHGSRALFRHVGHYLGTVDCVI